MALFDSPTITTQGAFVQMDGATIAGATAFPGIASGSAPDIDITTLRSKGREYRSGFQDPGTVTIPITLQPQSDVEKSLRDASAAGTQHQFTFRFGGTLDADTGYVTNVAQVISADLGSYTVSGRVLTTAADASAVPAVAVGDYLEVGGDDHKIASRAIVGGKAAITLGGTSAIDAYVAGTTLAKLLRPGVRVVVTASVQSFGIDINLDDIARGSLTLRLSGKPTYTLGSPDLS